MGIVYLLVTAGAIAAIVVRMQFRRVIVFEYERGVRYRNGRSVDALGPGAHWLLASSTVTRVDVRPTFVAVPGQEVLTADGRGGGADQTRSPVGDESET